MLTPALLALTLIAASDAPREHARVEGSYGLRGVSGDVAVTFFAPLRFDLGFVSRQTDSGVFFRVGVMIPLANGRDAGTGAGFSSHLSLLAGYRPPSDFSNPWWHGTWPIALADFTWWFTRELGLGLFGGGGALLRNDPDPATPTQPRVGFAIDVRGGAALAF